MRPELLVVGEVREAESLDLLIAMNSGIPGLCTIHANSASEAIQKLCTLPLLAGANISPNFVEKTVASCVNLVVHCAMGQDGVRYIKEIAVVKEIEGRPQVEILPLSADAKSNP
jgi:pilus assembly protein CpaF